MSVAVSSTWMPDRRANRHVGRWRPSRRRGALLMVALVALIAAAGLFGVLLQRMATGRRHLAELEARAQALWLLDSAWQRARACYRHDPGYRGEQWQPAFPGSPYLLQAHVTVQRQGREALVHLLVTVTDSQRGVVVRQEAVRRVQTGMPPDGSAEDAPSGTEGGGP